MRRLATLVATCTALSWTGVADAADHFSAVMTSCSFEYHVRALPGIDAIMANEQFYGPLTMVQSGAAIGLAKKIFGSEPTEINEVPVIFFGPPDAQGEQLKKEGTWPVQAVRAKAGTCSPRLPASLGKKGPVTYAMVEISCLLGKDPWNKIKIGMELSGDSVTDYCINLGAPASVVTAPNARSSKSERG